MDHKKCSRYLSLLMLAVLFIPALILNAASETVFISAIVQDSSEASSSQNSGESSRRVGSIRLPIQHRLTFKGVASPGSKISLLKDSVVVTEAFADSNGSFQISLGRLPDGVFNFGIRAKDVEGKFSILQVYTVTITSGVAVLVKGILLPPTLGLDKATVRPGENIIFSGRTAPGLEVNFVLTPSNQEVKKIIADPSGKWIFILNMSKEELGTYEAKVRVIEGKNISDFSPSVSFEVIGQKEIPQFKKEKSRYDLNNDSKVNLIDFNIMAYWYLRENAPSEVDFNSDGKVDLMDFSILAYYWTG